MTVLDPSKTRATIDRLWDDSIVPTLMDYIRIPNKSPAFDPDWEKHGHMDAAIELARRWCVENAPRGAEIEVVRLPGRTPVLLLEIPGDVDDTVLLYGHLDKQPEFEGWREGLGPWTPVLEDGRLYGRGGADDGYAVFGAISALKAAQEQGARLPRAVVVIETCEESGSYDLPAYVDHLAERIGQPSLVVCLDSGCGTYDRLWCTTSLRGIVTCDLHVTVLTEGVHSGDALGIVPSSFRMIRMLLDRLENVRTGAILPTNLEVEIPEDRIEQARKVAEVLGDRVWDHFPFVPGMKRAEGTLEELILWRTWRATMEVTGAGGLPPVTEAGNVLRPSTTFKISMRVPPTLPIETALETVRRVLTANPPYGARIELANLEGGEGWAAPPFAPWLEAALQDASSTYFGAGAVHMGEGGSIPFMGMLGKKFPAAQFMITGVLGPGSNAHGPNEFLDIETAKKVSSCVAHVLTVRAAMVAGE